MTSESKTPSREYGPKPPRVRPSLALPEGIEAGLIGGFSVALIYLIRDLSVGDPLFTPGVLGTLLIEGAATGVSRDPSAGAAAAFHLIHFSAWMVLGLLATFGVRQVEAGSWHVGTIGVGVAVAVVLTVSFDSWAAAAGLPNVHLWAGAMVGFGFMGCYLLWLHPDLAQNP
ncbi:MAG: hypothetical protein ACR2P8_01615 [Myxococcota bacterium]